MEQMHGTTILSVRRGASVAMIQNPRRNKLAAVISVTASAPP